MFNVLAPGAELWVPRVSHSPPGRTGSARPSGHRCGWRAPARRWGEAWEREVQRGTSKGRRAALRTLPQGKQTSGESESGRGKLWEPENRALGGTEGGGVRVLRARRVRPALGKCQPVVSGQEMKGAMEQAGSWQTKAKRWPASWWDRCRSAQVRLSAQRRRDRDRRVWGGTVDEALT